VIGESNMNFGGLTNKKVTRIGMEILGTSQIRISRARVWFEKG
jgi:hypothetical protein